MFIQDERNRTLWKMTLAIAVGILLGGATAGVENHACATAETPSGLCLTEDPQVRVVEGMVGGVFASGGALLAIELWQRWQSADGD